jgi:hypothetical protein
MRTHYCHHYSNLLLEEEDGVHVISSHILTLFYSTAQQRTLFSSLKILDNLSTLKGIYEMEGRRNKTYPKSILVIHSSSQKLPSSARLSFINFTFHFHFMKLNSKDLH